MIDVPQNIENGPEALMDENSARRAEIVVRSSASLYCARRVWRR
jgi:hypothetical protein